MDSKKALQGNLVLKQFGAAILFPIFCNKMAIMVILLGK